MRADAQTRLLKGRQADAGSVLLSNLHHRLINPGHPGSSNRRVDLKDDLSLSVLQARLVERDLPIKLVMGSL